ncbi:hypothetical protein NC797_01655 [Aquibacillus sp. 3ASR75-11]|uniref:Na+/proline symporter n=1 Tax=Terrihalobacillus insolitus TaxID=2950438 RepID=A0A9X3WNV7_9BACI|nr:hypothetical protein [Terrihalobacillus insolitus]MDC3412095.1 hypothetical protein [Terrihalobacillus insolitus]MDC3423212.1 hypothetical protein [Terrihalobacillus insolitus]
MIDWYLVMFVAATILLVYIEKLGEHKIVFQYMAHSGEIGLSGGTYAVLIQFMSGATLFLPIYVTVQMKLYSVFMFVLGVLAIYILLARVISNIKVTEEGPFSVLFKKRANVGDKRYFFIIAALSSFLSFLLHTFLVATLFFNIYEQSLTIGLSLFLFFCFTFFGLGGYFGVTKIGSKLVFGIFLSSVILSLSLFLKVGINSVYKQFTEIFPSLMDGSILENGLIVVTFVFVMFGQTCMNYYFWQSLHLIKVNHRLTVLRVSLFSWVALLLAYSALSIYILVQGTSSASLSRVLKTVVELESPFFPFVISLIWFSSLLVGAGTSLYSLVSLYLWMQNNNKKVLTTKQLLRKGYLVAMTVCLVTGFLSVYILSYTKEVLMVLAAFFSSIGFPFWFQSIFKKFNSKHYFFGVSLVFPISIIGVVLGFELWLITAVAVLFPCIIYLFLQNVCKLSENG